MPHITYAGPVLGNRDYGYVVGSGFSRSGFRLDTYHFLDTKDDNSATLRNPSGVVADWITSGSTETPHNAQLRQTPTLYVISDDFAFYDSVHTNKNASPCFLVYPFNTAEGSGNGLWVNKPRIDFIEDPYGANRFVKGETYRIKGEALTQYTSIIYNTAASNYDTRVYLGSGNDTRLYECTYYKLDGGDNQGNVNGESFIAGSFTVPTGVPNGYYNLYLYSRFHKSNIAVFSGINILNSSPLPSTVIVKGTDWGITGSILSNASAPIQDLIFVAASSIRNYAFPVRVVAELPDGEYLLKNPIYLLSGVVLRGPGRLFIDSSFDTNINPVPVIYTRSIPGGYIANDFSYPPGQGIGAYEASLIIMSECSALENLEVEFGTYEFGLPNGIYLTKKANQDNVTTNPTITYGGFQKIEDCHIHSHFPHDGTAIYAFQSLENVHILNTEIRAYNSILSYSSVKQNIGWKKKWRVIGNKFSSTNGRNTNNSLGWPLGIHCLFSRNEIKDMQRGLPLDEFLGPMFGNLVIRNNFEVMGNMFNGSEVFLYENRNKSYNGTAETIISTGIKLPYAQFSILPQNYGASNRWGTGVYSVLFKRLNVRSGWGKGQSRQVIGSTPDGWLQIDRPWDVLPDSNSVFQLAGSFDNNGIVGNEIRDCLGGIELYNNVYNNFISNNNFDNSSRGLSMQCAYQYGSIGASWYNNAQENIFDSSSIIIRTPRPTGARNAEDSILGLKIQEAFMVDSPITILDLQYQFSSDGLGTDKTIDFYASSAASGTVPSMKGLFFGGMAFDTGAWITRANKILNYSPFNVSPHGISGVISTATQKDSDFNGLNYVEVNGENRTLAQCTTIIGSNQRKWVDA